MNGEIYYSADGETFNHTCAEDAITDVMGWYDCLSPGEWAYIHKGEAVEHKPERYINRYVIDNLLEHIQDGAYDDAGESADGFTDISKEAKLELEEALKAWAGKHLKCHFYSIINIKEVPFLVTQKLLDGE